MSHAKHILLICQGLALALLLSPELRAEVGPAASFEAMPGSLLEAGVGIHEALPGTDAEDPRLWSVLESFRDEEGRAYECATPLVMEGIRALPGLTRPDADRVRQRLAPPRVAAPRIWRSPDGSLLVRYTTAPHSPDAISSKDEDADGVPDVLAVLDAAAGRARAVLADRMGWAAADVGPMEIVLATLPGPGAYVVPAGNLTPQEGVPALMVLDPGVLDADSGAVSIIAHQWAHVLQMRRPLREESWWYEATAAWAGLKASGDLSRLLPYLVARARHPEASLHSDTLTGALGGTQFLLYLEREIGESGIAETFESMEREDASLAETLDRELRRRSGSGLAEHVRRYQLWNLATGRRDTGRHFDNGGLLPEVQFQSRVTELPDSGSELGRAPQGLAANYLRFSTEGLEGGLRFSFEGDAGVAWSVDAVGVGEDGALEQVPMVIESLGRGALDLPASRYREVILVVQNLSWDPQIRGSYSWSAEPLPRYPFQLSHLDAEGMKGQVLLQWTSESEEDLYGWRVLRSETSEGPWQPLAMPVLPAIGGPGISQDYSWLDQDVVGGVQVWYRVEGITRSGVPVSSPVVGASAAEPLTPGHFLGRALRR